MLSIFLSFWCKLFSFNTFYSITILPDIPVPRHFSLFHRDFCDFSDSFFDHAKHYCVIKLILKCYKYLNEHRKKNIMFNVYLICVCFKYTKFKNTFHELKNFKCCSGISLIFFLCGTFFFAHIYIFKSNTEPFLTFIYNSYQSPQVYLFFAFSEIKMRTLMLIILSILIYLSSAKPVFGPIGVVEKHKIAKMLQNEQ